MGILFLLTTTGANGPAVCYNLGVQVGQQAASSDTLKIQLGPELGDLPADVFWTAVTVLSPVDVDEVVLHDIASFMFFTTSRLSSSSRHHFPNDISAGGSIAKINAMCSVIPIQSLALLERAPKGLRGPTGVRKKMRPYKYCLAYPRFFPTETHLVRKKTRVKWSSKCEGALLRGPKLFEGP